MENRKSYAMYFAALLMFGSNGLFASRVALNSYEIVFVRTLLGSLLLAGLFFATRGKSHLFPLRKSSVCLLVSGAAMGASWMFLYEAYKGLGVGVASLAYYCGPVFVMIAAPILFREKLTWFKTAGFLAVLVGMYCVAAESLGAGKSLWGLFCGLMSAVLYAVMVIFSKKATDITGLENAMWQLVAGFAVVAAFVGVKEGYAFRIEPAGIAPLLILSLFNTGVGCLFYFSGIEKLPVQTVAVCGYLEPLSAVVFSMLFLHETMTPVQLIGAALILGGAAFGELYGAKRGTARPVRVAHDAQ